MKEAFKDFSAPVFKNLTSAIRALAMDAVQKANSGHPGMPMGMAEIAEVLWNHHMRHNPTNPDWVDRDRFVLSNGHGSMLIYALLHLTGYDLSIEDIKNFRQLHSKTPGHPEYGYTPGVETTTGPLGQGITNAVGMALAEKILAEEFNRPYFPIVDHYTYVFLGDGCMMEGISHEACSLAGTLKLGKLVCFYDDNGISIDGHVEGWFTDNTPKRFESYGWHVVPDVNGHDPVAIQAAIEAAKKVQDKPTLICCKTVIGMGSPNKANTSHVHGAALGNDEIAAARPHIGWNYLPFEIPQEVYDAWDARAKGQALESAWNSMFAEYGKKYPAEAAEFTRRMADELPVGWADHVEGTISQINAREETIATRKASQNSIEALAPVLPELIGGSADLAGSNLTMWSGSKGISTESTGNYVFYGVREFGMSAIMNGLSLHGGIIPYGGTFLMFSEYARNALRMAALMKIRNIFVFTHDSIGLGEDGPTHQPVEQTATLRMIPNMDVWRPCDTVESIVSWVSAIERREGPSSLIFSRQNLPFQKRDAVTISLIRKGGYILSEAANRKPQAIIIATGSEIGLAMAAQKTLAESGIAVRVVSMPCTNIFDRQDQAYRDSVLPKGIARVAVEAGVTDYWRKYVGLEGDVIGIDRFGESAPAEKLFEYFGFTVENVVNAVKRVI
ncbi:MULTISPECIES: transketolase [Nitrosomonas]|uniref:Transketolase n=1 Tax=Nitrosomonas europaea (strain ATCC 19718 / CIP 103999 / KCTC 2705 / NBRC 14298) TaxID=228410 RepID=Q82XE6_NITEU|nr:MULTISPECIES: transketolase [Nitrosomonas]KXK44642.1 MAG: transketolase [Nitrosomonas europaea]MBV6390252.1 Transketolase 1 [Nitrosomonas europaea]CAD84239.1 Transketolase [Nitrosomonas europaea ATCC 19718]SDW36757.1 transketolase [Nitrosomonas europaea]SES95360.1 transketolase [Nitrosomonas europaea]